MLHHDFSQLILQMDVPQVLWTGIHIFHIEARIIIWVSYEAVEVQGLGLFSDISKGAGLEVGQLEFKLVLIWDAGAMDSLSGSLLSYF